MRPSEIAALTRYPDLRQLVDVHLDMQVNDVRCMLLSPLEGTALDAGYNFAAVSRLCELIGGASVLFYRPGVEALTSRGDRRERFTGLVKEFFPSEPLASDDVAKALWTIVRNPLTHALAISIDARVRVCKRTLSANEVVELEEARDRPVWCAPAVVHEENAYTVDAAGLYWGFFRALELLFASPEHAREADRLAARIETEP